MAANDINSIQDLLSVFERERIAKWGQAHIRFWFRGHSVAGWKLVPGVYRSGFKAETEADRLRLEQHLTQDFRIQSSGLRHGRNSEAEIYFLQQHYKMPTRLLDWSTSPLSALYFAVVADPTADGELLWMDAYRLDAQAIPKSDFHGIGSQRHPYFTNALKPIFNFGKVSDFPEYIFAVRPDYMDTRVNSQSSCFTFHVPNRPELTQKENDRLRRLRIPAASKTRLTSELRLLGIDHFSVFGDLEGLASRLRTAYSV